MVGELDPNVFDGEYEGGIEPWFSGVFSYYDQNMKRIETKGTFISFSQNHKQISMVAYRESDDPD